MEIDKKLNTVAQTVIASAQKKVIPQKLQSALLGRISTLNFILSESKIEILPDVFKRMLDELLDELEGHLAAINNEGTSFLARLYNWLPGSNLSKLQNTVPKLLEISDKIASGMSVHKFIEKSINTKRKADRAPGDEEDKSSDEYLAATQGYKKVKANPEDIQLNNSNSFSATSTTKVLNKQSGGYPFTVKMICNPELDGYLPTQSRTKLPKDVPKGTETSLCIRREEFGTLPKHLLMRMSKDHAVVTAKPTPDGMIYQLSDVSVNGVYYMGNRVDNTYMKGFPSRIKKEIPYVLKNGDIIGILMNKDNQNKDMILGFEFMQN